MDGQNIPTVTMAFTAACVITTAAVEIDLVTPLQLYMNPDLIFRKFQVSAMLIEHSGSYSFTHRILGLCFHTIVIFDIIWRLVTNFLFFGPLGFSFFFNMIFLYRYCRMLEETSFRGRTADFVFMFLFGGLLLTLFGLFAGISFMGEALNLMLLYIWCRRNAFIQINLLGLTIRAPFLPWVIFGLSLLKGSSSLVDFLGITTGHIYFFLEDVFPNQPGGKKLLVTPAILKQIFDYPEADRNYSPLPEDIANDHQPQVNHN